MDIYDRHQLHLHVIFLDGVFPRSKDDVKFSEHRAMSQESMFDVIEMFYLRPAKLFENKVFVMDSGEASVPDDVDSDAPRPFRPRSLKASPRWVHVDPFTIRLKRWPRVFSFKESRLMWSLKTMILPRLYWNFMLRGRA